MNPPASPAPASPIRFLHRGQVVSIDPLSPTRTVLDWLREDARCTGTKEGCNEGDCGACTVVIGTLTPAPDPAADPAADPVTASDSTPGLTLETVNACIRFLPTLDGKALFTVEDLKPIAAGALHPAQQAMVACHGSQCGFCTPGFMMSLWASYEHHHEAGSRPTRQQLADELAGNLCRCTGYRPILDAGEQMFEQPPVRLDRAAVIAQLQALDRDRAPEPAGGPPEGKPLPAAHLPSATPTGPRRARFFAPRTVAQLAELRLRHPAARLLAGATDIGLWVNKQLRDVGDLIYLGEVTELKRIRQHDGFLEIGAGASLEAAWQALAALEDELTEVWLRFASPPIRHAGTLGGNVANGSPIGDGPPVLIALDAEIDLRHGDDCRSMALADFYVDYMKNRLEPGEFLERIRVPLPVVAAGARRHLRAWKISKRYDSDISAVLGAFSLTLVAGRVSTLRLAWGGLAAIVRRSAAAEAALLGQPWTRERIDAAKLALASDFQPLSDMRASADYRLLVAQNLLERLWLETRADAPLGAASTRVYHRASSADQNAGHGVPQE